MEFDFSDHIVLSIVQYILPCMLEVHYSLILMQRDRRTLIPWLAVAAAGAIGLLCLRSMLLTCMFFHTFAENAVGFLIASLVAFLPFVAGSKPGAVLWITRTINSNSS